jgi:acetylornithine deacetylase/succinyl-diaminopimelate desuccinylase-like protein
MARASASATEALHKRPVELLQSLIRFDTTNPPGNERECIAYVDGLLTDAGMETTIRARDPERPNLVARLPGRGAAPPLLLYGHVDVVTTEHQRWRLPPFEARVEDGYVWGRGALDMKGGVAMMLSAVLRARASGLEPAGDVVFCALSDEEGFGDYGAKFMVENHAELFSDIRHAIGEFGGFTLHIGGRRFYPVQVAEKQLCTLRAVVRGPGGHGAMPVRGGAMRDLAEMIRAIDRARLPVHVTPVVRDMARGIAAALPPPLKLAFRQLASQSRAGVALRLLGDRAARLEPILRNTVSATIVNASDKVNVIPSEVGLVLDGRLLPGFGPRNLVAELREVVGDDVELEVVRHDPAPAEPDMALFGTLGSVLRHLDPGCVPVPLLMAGVTDGRFFSRIGIQTYGFLPMRLPAGFEFWQYVHAADERIPAAAVDFGSEAIYRVLERYGEETHPA